MDGCEAVRSVAGAGVVLLAPPAVPGSKSKSKSVIVPKMILLELALVLPVFNGYGRV